MSLRVSYVRPVNKKKEEEERKEAEAKSKSKAKLPFADEDEDESGSESDDEKKGSGDEMNVDESEESEESEEEEEDLKNLSLHELYEKFIPENFDSEFLEKSRHLGVLLKELDTPFPRPEDSIEKRLEIVKRLHLIVSTYEENCALVSYFTMHFPPEQSKKLFVSLFRKWLTKNSEYGRNLVDNLIFFLGDSTKYPFVFRAFNAAMLEALHGHDLDFFSQYDNLTSNFQSKNDFLLVERALIRSILFSAFQSFARACEERGISHKKIGDLVTGEEDMFTHSFDETLEKKDASRIVKDDSGYDDIRFFINVSRILSYRLRF
jgi:hypothetical protein